ncbi:MAG: sugar phosphate isomerase/epimerase family protein [Solirubrobacterales bacterium]
MGTATKAEQRESVVARHHPVGASTGYLWELRGDWDAQVAAAWRVSSFAVELSALSERELPSLTEYLRRAGSLPFRYLSIHGPSKHREMDEEQLVRQLCDLAQYADGIVVHPDTIERFEAYGPLGQKLLLENMDSRKANGRTPSELAPAFAVLPEAGFCFDVAHAWSVDSSMAVANELLDELGDRLRHVHLSSLSDDLHHVSLRDEDEDLFSPVLGRCRDVPWILEAPPRADSI